MAEIKVFTQNTVTPHHGAHIRTILGLGGGQDVFLVLSPAHVLAGKRRIH